jgi:hypothetical protein
VRKTPLILALQKQPTPATVELRFTKTKTTNSLNEPGYPGLFFSENPITAQNEKQP